LFVSVAERHPFTMRLQHDVHVLDDSQVVVKDGLADGAAEYGGPGALVAKHLKRRCQAGRSKYPGIGRGCRAGRLWLLP
jgi:hypothetical protein